MSRPPTTDERLAALERQVAWLTQLHCDDAEVGDDDWRSTVGMFAGDPIMKEIIEEGRKIREQDRELTRVKLPLVNTNAPGSLDLTNQRIGEILDEEDAADRN